MPRKSISFVQRSAFRAAGWAAYQRRLQERLGSLAPLPAFSEKAWHVAGSDAGVAWKKLSAWRSPDATPAEFVETTQALSPAWTAVCAWQRFTAAGLLLAPGIHSSGSPTILHFIGAAKAERSMPHALFFDLPALFGHTELHLVGPGASEHASIQGALTNPHCDSSRQLSIQVKRSLYHNSNLGSPSLALALNAGLQSSYGRHWLPTMKSSLETKTPTVITGYNADDVVGGLACMFAHGLRPRLVFGGRNPFGSLLGQANSLETESDSLNCDEELRHMKKHAKRIAKLGLRELNRSSCILQQMQPGQAESPAALPLCNSFWLGFCGEK
eukprot:TRINITY_DN60442_c0_g1_i1.p1 TRINITY_DN60442_c0_g1~~TRINITY_DN60442_c0_g1_i1.p1  ORF type:complete len:328 (+),score=40.11 TRINITY_DN60442_c0_g1_i1:79-1062(+)